MDAQATGEAFNPQKRTSSTLKHENALLFSIFVWVIFDPWIRSRIYQLKLMRIQSDPDPQPLLIPSSVTQHYILTHPELFPEPKRVKFIDYIAPWTPIRY
jgi:hypothetical protein